MVGAGDQPPAGGQEHADGGALHAGCGGHHAQRGVCHAAAVPQAAHPRGCAGSARPGPLLRHPHADVATAHAAESQGAVSSPSVAPCTANC